MKQRLKISNTGASTIPTPKLVTACIRILLITPKQNIMKFSYKP